VEQLEVKEAQLAEVLAAANLDPHTLQQVRHSTRHGASEASHFLCMASPWGGWDEQWLYHP
jgi:hypothetical protein